MKDNLLLREEYAFFNAQLWMTNVGGLSMETLHGIARGEKARNNPVLRMRDRSSSSAEVRKTGRLCGHQSSSPGPVSPTTAGLGVTYQGFESLTRIRASKSFMGKSATDPLPSPKR